MGDLIQVLVSADDVPEWLIVKRGTMTTRTDFAPVGLASIGAHGFKIGQETEALQSWLSILAKVAALTAPEGDERQRMQ